MKRILGILAVCWLLVSAAASADLGPACLGVGFGLHLQDAELAGEPAIEPCLEGFIAWQMNRTGRLRVGLHWAPFAGPAASELDGDIWDTPIDATPGAGEAVHLVDVRVTAVWLSQRQGGVQPYGGGAFGVGGLLFPGNSDEWACVVAPTFGISFGKSHPRVSIETSIDIVIGEETRFGVIPVRVLIPF